MGDKTKKEQKPVKEQKPKREPGQKQERSTVPVYRQLRTKLIAAFMVPVLCIIALGVLSYRQASNAIISNYESAVEDTMSMTNQYMDLVIDTVRSDYNLYLSNVNLSRYFKGELNENEGNTLVATYTKEITRNVGSDTSVSNLYFISGSKPSISTATLSDEAVYDIYVGTPEGALVDADHNTYFLFGNQSDADGALGTDSSQYSLRMAKYMGNNNAIMLLDFTHDIITDTLTSLYAGEGSYVALITRDGTEFYSDGTSVRNGVFGSSDFYQNVAGSQESGMQYVTYNGEAYLFLYSPLMSQSAMLCTLIPESLVLAQVADIKTTAVALVIFAVIIAVLLGYILSTRISGSIYYILRQLKKVADGDLTVHLTAKSKDEIRLLADGVNSMADSMKALITNVTEASNALNLAAEQVSSSSETFMVTAGDIQDAISEIESGVTQLDENSDDCLTQMDALSGKIANVTDDTKEIISLTESTSTSITDGISSMSTLTDSAKKTSNITNNVIEAIEALSDKSRSIGQIVESINDIAAETNLLSLNASIEAARAGEAGRGFAVVAEEIRKLADQSAQSAGQIQEIIDDIIDTTSSVVNVAKEAATTVEYQEKAVAHTKESFLTMDQQVHSLLNSISEISESMQNMEHARNTTLSAIESISAVSAQTAAGSSNVSTTVTAQRDAIHTLDAAANTLQQRAEELTELLNQFTI